MGSSSVRAVAYDEHGDAEPGDARVAYRDLDADRLVEACRAVLAQVGEGDALALSCFWHSLVALDAGERPLGPVLTWRDTAGDPPQLDPAAYHRRTGCFLHPAYWPAKLRRLADEGVRPARVVSFADYLLLRLTGELRTTVSMASGTGLFDPNRLVWDDETLAAVGLDPEQLPPVCGEPVASVHPALGDGACSNVGVGCVERGRVALTVGTSGAARVVYAAKAAEPRPGLFLYRVDDRRFCEGGALSDGGNLHGWLQQTLRDLDTRGLDERPAAGHGLVFLPFLGGERSLGWDASRRGLVRGLSFATTPLDIAQAALEGVCYRFAAVLDALGDVDSLVVTGGALLSNPGWVQVLADVLGRPLEVSASPEGSARGAALTALEQLGVIISSAPIAHVVEPRADRHEIHARARRVQETQMQIEEEA
ncbi:MAG: gluconokinase [Thermoleophilaceae bacterium]|nr:gluconokinase [Thermoleophilaceae bacterium]